MSNAWFHPPVANYDEQGQRVSEANFRVEARTELAIFIRELLQNSLDARSPENDGPVEVRLKLLGPGQVRTSYLASIVDDDLIERLIASSEKSIDIDPEKPSALVIEDFGTTGLLGTFTDSTIDGREENWNSFWFREGEGSKGAANANGGAGQGKVTFYGQGDVRVVIAYTIRTSDRSHLLMGRASFRRDYRVGISGPKFKRNAYWCRLASDSLPLPAQDANALKAFKEGFAIDRTNEPGVSLVVPFPRTFDAKEALKVVLAEFFFPIARHRLVVTVSGIRIASDTVEALADAHLTDREVRDSFGLCLTAEYRKFLLHVIRELPRPVLAKNDWASDGVTLTAKHFDDGVAQELKAALAAGRRIHVRFPIRVRKQRASASNSFFDVYLQLPDGLSATEEAYIRNDLLIGKERKLHRLTHLPKARALTFISDPDLSQLMADAEEASHLEWNAKREKLLLYWTGGGEVLRQVRNALPRLLSFLVAAEGSKDTKALARFFSKPEPGPKKGGRGKNRAGESAEDDTDPPPPRRQPFVIAVTKDAVTVSAKDQPAIVGAEAKLQIAFEEIVGNPFKAYDPFDFDLAKPEHALSMDGCVVLAKERNEIRYRVERQDMTLSVSGFEASNIPLVTRLTFQEPAHGSDDEAK